MENVAVDMVTGEVAEIAPHAAGPDLSRAGTLRLTPEQVAILRRESTDDEIDILPTGELYLPQVGYRRRLLDAFGPGGWAMYPVTPVIEGAGLLTQEYHLYVDGTYVASAVGECEIGGNQRMTRASAVETTKSNALMRLCKDLGIASECWDRQWIRGWKERMAVCVQVAGRTGVKWQWRRKDAPAFSGEATGDGKPAAQRSAAPPRSSAQAAPQREAKPAPIRSEDDLVKIADIEKLLTEHFGDEAEAQLKACSSFTPKDSSDIRAIESFDQLRNRASSGWITSTVRNVKSACAKRAKAIQQPVTLAPLPQPEAEDDSPWLNDTEPGMQG